MMFRLISWVMAIAFAFAGWRNLPRLEQPQSSAAGFCIGGCVLLAFYAGTRVKRDSAVAIATARAEARALAAVQASTTSHAVNQVQVVFPGQGARAAGAGLGLEDAPWMVGAHRAVELDELEVVETAMADVLDSNGGQE